MNDFSAFDNLLEISAYIDFLMHLFDRFSHKLYNL